MPITLGIPTASVRIYILNSRRDFVPIGVVGEIYLAGIQISRGYIGKPKETAQRFMADTICQSSNEAMFKTGDSGYWNEDGEIVYIGRNDRQVKLRGFRIDLDEVELRILKVAPRINAIAVVQEEDFLIAAIEPSTLDVRALRSCISKVLPPYSVPRHIVAIENLPMTTNGKVNHKAIKEIRNIDRRPNTKLLQSPSYLRMLAVWREVLGFSTDFVLNPSANFTELGGNSIHLMLLSSKLSKVYRNRVPVRLIVENPIMHDLINAIEWSSSEELVAPPPVLGDFDLSEIERDWWDKYEIGKGCSAFNVSYCCTLGKSIDLPSLTLAWNRILARHSVLSCNYIVRRRFAVHRTY